MRNSRGGGEKPSGTGEEPSGTGEEPSGMGRNALGRVRTPRGRAGNRKLLSAGESASAVVPNAAISTN